MKIKFLISTLLVISVCFVVSGSGSEDQSQPIPPPKPEEIKFIAATPDQQKTSPPDMVFVPAGEFMMGCNEPVEQYCNTPNKPFHKVYLDAFYIDKFEVTVRKFGECVKAGKCRNYESDSLETVKALGCSWAISGTENQPENCVNWNQADAYCRWAGKSLPTEAQWEKAARGTDGRMYPWGNQTPTCDYAVFFPSYSYESTDPLDRVFGCRKNSSWPVGSKPAGASPYGAMDMAGNVGEWVADLYGYSENYYESGPKSNPTGPETGIHRMMRGGGWAGGNEYIRTSYRSLEFTTGWDSSTGFRCAMGTDQDQKPMPTPPSPPEPPAIPVKPGEMVTVPAGEFIMGSTGEQLDAAAEICGKSSGEFCSSRGFENEYPPRKVTLDEFQIDKYEVTVGQYLACIEAGKCTTPDPTRDCYWGDDWQNNENLPIRCVDWEQSKAFCKWDGKRLPTEAEWEKAARGTDGRIYPWGNETATCKYAVLDDFGDSGCGRETRIWPVGGKPAGASPYGAMDMAGNVSEWVADFYDEEYYAGGPSLNPTGPKLGTKRAYRGGDWASYASGLRAAMRGGEAPDKRYSMVGFRCAKGNTQTPEPAEPPPPPVEKATPGEMVLVPAGDFLMGCNMEVEDSCMGDTWPLHKVFLDAYKIDKYDITVQQYAACVKAGKCTKPVVGGTCNWGASGREDHPINCVTWIQSDAYCKWAGHRLPTEAQWEKAARGTDGRAYPWGNKKADCNYAVMDECGKWSTWPVGSKPMGASPYGAMDMAGNVWNWVADWHDEDYYKNSPARNPKGPPKGTERVLRGGSFNRDARSLRSSNRNYFDPSDTNDDYGFRCAETP